MHQGKRTLLHQKSVPAIRAFGSFFTTELLQSDLQYTLEVVGPLRTFVAYQKPRNEMTQQIFEFYRFKHPILTKLKDFFSHGRPDHNPVRSWRLPQVSTEFFYAFIRCYLINGVRCEEVHPSIVGVSRGESLQ